MIDHINVQRWANTQPGANAKLRPKEKQIMAKTAGSKKIWAASGTTSRRRLIAFGLALSLVAAGGVFAQWRGLFSTSKNRSQAVAQVTPQSLQAGSPSKEYIYAGSRLVATEEPSGGGGGSTNSATFVRTDTTTQGNWRTLYGADGYNVINDSMNYPSYAQVVPSGQSSWTWAASTTNIRALQKGVGSDRIAAIWYSTTSFFIDVNLTDGATHQVALYCLDWDNDRTETVDALDATTSAVLDSRTMASFFNGKYLVWNIKGHVKFRLTYVSGTVGNNAVVSGIFFGTGSSSPINVALASNGATVTASSTYAAGYPASGAINGDRKGLNWANGGGWADGTNNVFPDWLQVSFSGSKTINEIDVFTVQDDDANPLEPTPSMTFTTWGITEFSAQYWNGSAWVTVPGGSVIGNNNVWRKFTFSNITTDRIRILVTNALFGNSRITEVEAYAP